MSDAKVQGFDFERLLDLVRQAAVQQEQLGGVAPLNGAGIQPIPITGCDFSTALFPDDQVASSAKPRTRSGNGVNMVEARLAQKERDLKLAATLFESGESLKKSTAEADQARRELEAFQDMLERRMMSGIGHRSLARFENRLDSSYEFEMDRRYWWERDMRNDFDKISWRRVQQELEDQQRRYNQR